MLKRKNHLLAQMTIVVIAVGLFSGCAPAADEAVDRDQPTDTMVPSDDGDLTEAKSGEQRVHVPIVDNDDLVALVAGNNKFAIDLYKQVTGENENIFFSPFSISLALSMAQAGAEGDTLTQMMQVLGTNLPEDDIYPALNWLESNLSSQGEGRQDDESTGFELNIANSTWAQMDHPFQQEYLDVLARNFGSGLNLVDFVKESEAARIRINDWVSDKTAEKISDLVPPGVIDAQTRLVLANAIYFNAKWQYPFDPNATDNGPFFLSDGSQVDVPMMRLGGSQTLAYKKGDDYQALELPYMGDKFSMVLIVPDPKNFNAIEQNMTLEWLDDVIVGLKETSVVLSMPKFSYETALGLADTLSGMGITDAFSPDASDFSGMDGSRDLFISDVLHKAFVAVDEEGTEAAAATAVIIGITSAPIIQVELTIDRPFIFLIRDKNTGLILFLGKVINPS